MDAAAFEQVDEAFQDSHAYFAPLFGRRETRDHSRHYLQALLVQSGERRNAENLSEAVPASARVMQRFLAESPWDDDTVIGRLQEYLGPRLGHPDAVWVLDGSDFPKQGRKSVGVARQYCGRLGGVASCQARNIPGLWQPVGTLPWSDKRQYLPEPAGPRTKTDVRLPCFRRRVRAAGRSTHIGASEMSKPGSQVLLQASI